MSVEIRVPDLGESVVEATIARWLKKEGEPVKVGEAVVELETEKVNLEVAAEKDGVLQKIAAKDGEDVKVGDVIGTIDETGTAKAAPAAQPEPAAAADNGKTEPKQEAAPTKEETAAPAPAADGQRVTPVAERVAEQHGVDISRVQGTGPGGKVNKSDVEKFVSQQSAAPASSEITPAKPMTPARTQAVQGERYEERIKMSRRRRTIARRLVEALQTAAMLTTFNEIDMSAVMELRARHKESFKQKNNVSLGLTSFFVKASVGALKDFPRLNAEIQGDEMVLKHYYDIGVAIGDPEGLVVPVIRDSDRKSFAQIEQQVREFAAQAQNGQLSLDDLTGGTFTITNGGVFGSMLSTPILNPPQVGILGLHNIVDRAVVKDGQIVVRPIMYVALSYDHRIVDGREAVQFLFRVKELMEDPASMLFEV
jgi:2-oxoglutarate dehydrogenase E2 component (dihydrolipoamide succinyltransferase)